MALSDEHRKSPVIAANAGSTLVAWETLTGEPIEATVRRRTADADSWPRAVAVSERDARAPSVAVATDGTALLAWQGYDGDTPVIRVARSRAGGWSAATIVSTRGRGAREPQIAVDATGRVTVAWLSDVGTLDSSVAIATADDPDGPFGPPVPVGAVGRLSHLRLAVAADGTAALTWSSEKPHRAIFAAAGEGGRWGEVARISPPDGTPTEPNVAAAAGGRAAVIWTSEDGAGAHTSVARYTAGSWQVATIIDRADGPGREMSRPGRAVTAPAVAMLPDGIAAAWSRDSPHEAQVRGARADDATGGTWSTPYDLSRPEAPAGGIDAIAAAGATALAGWEEQDDGLLRARVGPIDGSGGCLDLAPSAGETGGVRLAGVAGPTAVFVDFSRSRVMAVDLP